MTTYYGIRRYGGTGPQLVFRDNDPLSLKPSQRLVNHSPDGFNWGYGGDGPKQLALALLLDVTGDPKTALRRYQAFKQHFVAMWREAWFITDNEISDWLRERHEVS